MEEQHWSYEGDRGWTVRRRPPRPCPKCGAPALRVSRRTIDRLFSVLKPVRRYRCGNAGCAWIGNLRSTISDADASKRVWAFGFLVSLFAFFALGVVLLIFVV